MYNEDLKQKFILEFSDKESTRHACVLIFNACEKYERQWGADICTRPTEELQKIMEHLVGLRENGRHPRFTILRAYTRWCVENGVEGAVNGMEDVDISGVGKLRFRSVRSPLHLQRYLDALFDPESEKTTENIYRAWHWLAYSGMKEEDAVRVRASDVKFADLVIRVGTEEYPVYREAIPCLRVCVRQKQFLYKHPNYRADVQCWKDRMPGDLLLRGIRSDPTVSQLRGEISRRTRAACDAGKTELRLSWFRIWISGVFYRKYEQELAGVPVDFTDLAWADMEGKTYRLGTGHNTLQSYMRRLRKQYETDYANWKQTLLP